METYYILEEGIINTEEGKLYPFNINKFYRYLDVPYNVKDTDNILSYFFGNDKSYRQSCPFDNGDIIVEFNFININEGFQIGHHPLSYRGPLIENEINIRNIFINKRDDKYDIFGASTNYLKHIKNLVNNTKKEYIDKIVYYDTLNETQNFSKILKNEFFKNHKNNLIYNGVFIYN